MCNALTLSRPYSWRLREEKRIRTGTEGAVGEAESYASRMSQPAVGTPDREPVLEEYPNPIESEPTTPLAQPRPKSFTRRVADAHFAARHNFRRSPSTPLRRHTFDGFLMYPEPTLRGQIWVTSDSLIEKWELGKAEECRGPIRLFGIKALTHSRYTFCKVPLSGQ